MTTATINTSFNALVLAAWGMNLPKINREQGESFNLIARTEMSCWTVLATVRTEAELRAVYASLEHLIPAGAMIKADRFHSYDKSDFSWRSEPVAL